MTDLHYDFLNINLLTDEDFMLAKKHISPTRLRRIEHFRCPADRKRSIAADLLARRMAAQLLDTSADMLVVEQLDGGQPVLPHTPFHISLSHSGAWVMCALCSDPVGADIEIVSDRGIRLVNRICSCDEQAYILSSGEYDPVRFFQVWTAKEAVLKRRGKGLSGGISTTVVASSDGLLPSVDGASLICGQHEDAVYSIVC